MISIGSPLLWVGFLVFVLGMLAIDLGIFHRKAHEVNLKEALIWSLVWIGLALLFNLWIQFQFGPERALEFLTGYIIEKSLSVDNIFIFVVIFSSFAVPAVQQHRVLFWGIIGALVMRGAFIVGGAALLQRFHWMMYFFGALLVVTGIKLLIQRNQEPHPERNPLFRLASRFIPAVSYYEGGRFIVKRDGRRFATPLLLVLISVELTDVVFAVDSIPAIFAITNDPFIVFTSNIFAILGLRSLYFLLAGVVKKLIYLKVGLAIVLIFVGAKMCLVHFYKVPIPFSLLFIAGVIGGSVVASLWKNPKVGGGW